MISIYKREYRLVQPFVISRGARVSAEVIEVNIARSGHIGRGESLPYARFGDSFTKAHGQISQLPPDVTRTHLQTLLPAGAARNAVDCALWDLEGKSQALRVWQLLGLVAPKPLQTAYTLSLDTPQAMRERAMQNADRPILKLKLGGVDDLGRLEAVRAGAPKSRLIVDANEGWTLDIYQSLAPYLMKLGVVLVEQPFPADEDDILGEIARPLPICADESCHDRTSLAGLLGKYDMVNIKLDKAGGLTEAIALRDQARAMGFGVMVGCMVTSSLAIAPAVLLAQGVDMVDLDAPMLLADDQPNALEFDRATISPPTPQLWG